MDFQQLTLADLQVFSDLSQQGSLRALSRLKGCSPSQISKTLRRVERKLGTQLLQRSVNGMTLTPDGIQLLSVADRILEQARGLSPRGTPEQKEPKLVSIAAPRFVASDLLAPLVARLKQEQRDYRFRLLDMSPDQLGVAAFRSACEVLITIDLPGLSRAWDSRKVGALPWNLYCHTSHPLGEHAEPLRVLGFPFIVPQYWTGERFEQGNDFCPIPWERRRKGEETSSISTALRLLENSTDALVFAPRVVAQPFVRAGKIREVTVNDWPTVSKPVYLSVRADRVDQRLHRALLQLLKRELLR
ncbi:LysR family transcriptional regulator [bacterium]|nr:LysR family transcriptional regulator [bacterium]